MNSTDAPSVQPGNGSLRDYLRRGGVAVVVCLLLGAGAGLLVTARQQKKYMATATVLVSATGVDSSATQANARTTGVINLDTEAQLVKSAAVAKLAETLDPAVQASSTDQLLKNLQVSVPANTTVLNIAYTATTPAAAQAVANAFVAAYLADRKATAQSLLTSEVNTAQSSVTSLTGKLKALSSAEFTLPATSPQRPFDTAQRGLYTSQISTLNQQLIGLTATQITPGRVLTEAALPTKPSSPSRILNIGSGLAVGLLVGLFIAWLRVTHRRRVRRVDDLAPSVDVPGIAFVRKLDPEMTHILGTAAGEVYRRLAVLTMSAIEQPATVVVSTVGRSRSDRTIAAGLGTTLAAGGASVALLRVGDCERTVSVPDQIQVTVVARAETVRLDQGGASVKESLDRLRGDRDILIVDAPGPTRTADASALAVRADAVVLVVDTGARIKDLCASVEQLDSISAPMLGIVLVRSSRLVTLRRQWHERTQGDPEKHQRGKVRAPAAETAPDAPAEETSSAAADSELSPTSTLAGSPSKK